MTILHPTAPRVILGSIWILWPLIGTLVPRGRFLDLTILVTVAVMVGLLSRRLGSSVRISISRDARSLAALAGSQLATVGMALYVAGTAATRILLWSTAQKVFAMLVAGSVLPSAWGPTVDFGWIFGHVSDLQAGAEAADLPYLP
jgi:hypothetical protein